MIAILDNIRSAYNVGSILRTCDGAGICHAYLCGITPTPIDQYGRARPDIAKAALGAEKSVPWEYVASTDKIIHSLKEKGYYCLALERDSRSECLQTYHVPINADHLVVVVGNEVEGLSQSVFNACDDRIEIPMYGSKESLNCSVAFGIAVYSLLDRVKK